ncbi:DDB1-and CUL4-associated factor 8 [Rhynchospora pubera]|uniref:DDB1-and CUL4-associated factor 8 n=1 Tax=Rhynchospora pubera TaxID=906938 RepID=A0AAV8CEM5_9POAL|nr:DDB1-and CUL4-associated factor 8 [Rhynchospora pubera]
MAETDRAGPSEERTEVELEEKPYHDRTSAFCEIRKRELGLSRPTDFSRRVGGSEALVKRMTEYGKLHGHKGCVNTVCFNSKGDILVSGSDDKDIIFWDWAVKTKTLSYNSGHSENVFQARIMPFSDDCTVISSAADGQVRVGKIKEDCEVSTKQIGSHRGRVRKIAIEPGSSHVFYSCGEDGLVQHFDLRSPSPTKLFICSSIRGNRRLPLNGIVIDPRNPNFFSIGGVDEYARLYDLRMHHQTDPLIDQPVELFCPNHLIKSNGIHVTGLSYSNTSELLVSYNDELIYLFTKDMGMEPDLQSVPQDDSEKNEKIKKPQVYVGHRNAQTVKGPSFFGLRDEYVVSGSDCGHVYIWRKKGGELICMMHGDKYIVNCIEPHPYFPFLATSGFDKSIKLWTPTAIRSTPLPRNAEKVMEANKAGREARVQSTPDIIMHVLRLQRRQAFAYIERRPAAHGSDGEDEGGEGILVEFSNVEDGEDEDPRGCSIT